MKKLFVLYFALLLLVFARGQSFAQGVSEAPRAEYYLARELYENGRLADATEGFRLAVTRSMKVREKPWVDSIPPIVMLGESLFFVGRVAEAMEQYDAALMIAIANPNWIEQVTAPEQLQPIEGKAKVINWFTASRNSQSMASPERGQLTVTLAAQPGAGQPLAITTRVDTAEILRTMGLALIRRGEVLGPLAKYSPLAQPLNQLLARDVQQRAPWLRAAWLLLRGFHSISVKAAGDPFALMRQNALIANEFDYFMTPLALLQIGKYQWLQQDLGSALTFLQDATLIAARHEQYSMLAESLEAIAGACSASNRTDLLAAIQNAATWGSKRSASVQAYGFAGAGELAAVAGDWNAAESNCKLATVALRNREIVLPRAQAQLSWASALVAFGENRGVPAHQHLDAALKIMRGNARDGALAKQTFQSQMVVDLLANNAIMAVDAEETLNEILREPEARQWQTEPLETIAAMTTSSVPAYATWLGLAESRGAKELVVERMDRLLRQRFYEALPLGGRLFSWRTAILSDSRSLPQDVQANVAQAAKTSPDLFKGAQRVASLFKQIGTLPLPIDDRQITADAKKNFTEFTKAVEQLENQLTFQALQRTPLDRFIPFKASIAKIQSAIDDNDLLLGFVTSGGKVYGTAISKKLIEIWSSPDLAVIEGQIKLLLSEIGIPSSTKFTPSQIAASNAPWRELARDIFSKLMPAHVQAMVGDAARVIIVPDGPLWYLPFELLPTDNLSSQSNWLSRHPMVYLPTLGSLPLINRNLPIVSRKLQLTGLFFNQDKILNASFNEKMMDGVKGSQQVDLNGKNHSSVAHWARVMVEQLVVTAKIEPANRLLETNLFPIDGSRVAQLGGWIESPRRSPSRVIFPGFQSAAATAGNLGDGSELFIPACSLMYSGTGTMLLSRWPVGGRSSQVVLSRYLDELSSESPSSAWRRSVVAMWADEFLIAEEPSLLPSGKESAVLVNGQHPKLWSSYMIIGDNQTPSPAAPPTP